MSAVSSSDRSSGGVGNLATPELNVSRRNLNQIVVLSRCDSSTHKCDKSSSILCYICSKFASQNSPRKFSELIHIYESVFRIKPIRDEGKTWAPTSICNSCRKFLDRQTLDPRATKTIVYPGIQREPKTEGECMTRFKGMLTTKHIVYANALSFTSPILRMIMMIL